MAVSRDQVLAFLTSDEPDYASATELGSEALPILEALLNDMDQDVHPGIPAKATSLVGMIGGSQAADVLKIAGASSDPTVRVAAAAAASYLSAEQAADVLGTLIKDDDLGVQKTALMATPSIIPTALKRSIETIDAGSSDPAIVDLRDRALQRDVEARTERDRTPRTLNEDMGGEPADMGGEQAESATTGMPGGGMPMENDMTNDGTEAAMSDGTSDGTMGDAPMPDGDMR